MIEPAQKPAYRELVPVFHGDLPEAILLRSALEAHGIEGFIPNENIKTVDPFATGANALSVELACPAVQADDARELIDGLRREEPPPVDEAAEREELRVMGRRVRWSTLCLVTAPFGAWMGTRYLHRASVTGLAPANHAWNVLCALFAAAATLALLVWGLASLAG